MKLGTKLFWTLALVMAALVLTSYVIAERVVLRGFYRIEEDRARLNVTRAQRAIAARQDRLMTSVTDWSEWDSAYRYMHDPDAEFARENLVPTAFQTLNIHFLAMINMAGDVVWSGGANEDATELIPLSDALLSLMATNSPLALRGPGERACAGFVRVDGEVAMVASRLILTSDANGPPAGVLVMGQFLREVDAEELSEDVQQDVILLDARSPTAPSSLLAALQAGSEAEVRALDQDILAGYGLLHDIFGQPLLIVQVDMPRDISKQGRHTYWIFAGFLLLAGVVFTFLLILIQNRMVVARVQRLGALVSRVATRDKPPIAIALPGRDELSKLAGEIDGMVKRETAARSASEESQRQYQVLFREMFSAFALHEIICDPAGKPVDYRFLAVNPAFERQTGLHAGQVIGRTVREVLPGTDTFWVETYGHVALTGDPVSFEHYSEQLDKYYEVSAYRPAPGQFATVFAEVTDRKRAERKLRESEQRFRNLFERHRAVMLLIDPQSGAIVDANASAEAFYGYSRGALRRLNIEEINCLPPDQVKEERIRAVREERNYFIFPHRLASGEVRQVEVHSSPVDEGGRILLFSIVHDVTERERAQEQVRALLEESNQARLALLGILEDQKRSEQALVASRASYRDLFENMLSGYAHCRMIYDNGRPVDFEYLNVNPAFAQITGLTDVKGRKVSEVIPGIQDSNPELFEIYGRVCQSGKAEMFETLVPGLGISFSVSVHCPHPGEFVAVFNDVTARRAAEQALRDSEARFRSYVETSPMAILVTDPNGRYVDCNPAAVSLLGYDPPALYSKTILDVVSEEDRDAAMRCFRRVVEEGRCGGEFRLLRDDGRRIWVMVHAARVSRERFMAYCLDITARKEVDELLRKQSTALRAAANAIVITNRAGIIQWVNPAFAAVTGYTESEAVGRNPRDLIKSGQHDAKFYRNLWETVLAGHVWRGEIVNRRKDGQLYTEEMTITPVRDETGQITNFVAIKQDITDRKRMESHLLRTQRLESVGRLASGIAHDLNNILTPVLMAPAILREAIQDKAVLSIVDSIEASAERGAAIIKQLLTFGRGAPTRLLPIAPRSLAREMMKIIEETFPKNIHATLELPPDVALVNGDATQLHQVLMNLCVNARDAMPKGGSLTLAVSHVVVDAAMAQANPGARTGPHVQLRVSDTGTGIQPADMDKIFDPFFTTKAPGEGTGLGLSTVLAIVRGHDGFLQVESQPGCGTTFRIYLPVAEDSDELHPHAKKADVLPRGHGELVLVVDDEERVRHVTRQMIERNGYQCLEAGHGEEALAMYDVQRESVRAVVTDLMMPVMDGPTLIRALRERNAKLPIIAISGFLSQPELVKAVEADAQVFLSKPCSASDLLHALQTVLRPA